MKCFKKINENDKETRIDINNYKNFLLEELGKELGKEISVTFGKVIAKYAK